MCASIELSRACVGEVFVQGDEGPVVGVAQGVVCSSLHFVRVYVRRVIHAIVHNGLTDVENVLVVVHTFP